MPYVLVTEGERAKKLKNPRYGRRLRLVRSDTRFWLRSWRPLASTPMPSLRGCPEVLASQITVIVILDYREAERVTA
jgi:hypothetical protein